MSNYVTGSVTSKDGTIIGYRQIGHGPGIILLHGGVKGSQSLTQLGSALSDEFTVYIPDRRGRGMSGPFGDHYGLKREVEDMDALIKKTGAEYVFGTSTGGIIALQSALCLNTIHKLVLFELPIYVNQTEMDNYNAIINRYDKEVSEGKLTSAMLTASDISSKVSNDPISKWYFIPNAIWRPIFRILIEADGLIQGKGDVTIKELIPTFHYDLILVNETKGRLADYKNVSAKVLLLSGKKPLLFLRHSLDALKTVLPHSKRVVNQKIDHDASENYLGKPKIVAQEIKEFYREK
jgi:pimeloyl-ACP methyl ester carboxylesterase